MKWLKRAIVGLVIAIATLTALSIWMVRSESGARSVAALVRVVLGDRLELGRVEGTLAGPLLLTDICYRDPAVGVRFAAERIDVDVAWSHLPQRIVRVQALVLTGLDVWLDEPTPSKPQQRVGAERIGFAASIDAVVIDALRLKQARIHRDQMATLEIAEAWLAGRWSTGLSKTLAGRGAGSFEWHAGGRTYAGNLQLLARDERADLSIEINVPSRARLDLSLVRRHDAIDLDGLLRSDVVAGEMRLSARLQRRERGLRAHANMQWSDVVVPASLAGQDLHSSGQLELDGDIDGSLRSYAATGRLSVGPLGRMADVVFKATGSPQSLRLEQVEILQGSARLALGAEIDLQPRAAWSVRAQAWQFDPGVFVAAWNGKLNFSLDSEGRLLDDGPLGSLRLAYLTGSLRGRQLAGAADLQLMPQRIVAGTLTLKSGESRLRFDGARGESMDANFSLEVASMSDVMPDAGGELTARASLRGRWPAISISGDSRGHAMLVGNIRADSLALQFEVENPIDLRGSASAQLAGLAVEGWRFDSLIARVSGSPDAHEFALNARGELLGAQLALQGSRTAQGWEGLLGALTIDVKEVARLRLHEPVHIAFGQGEFDVSRACLGDGEIELCSSARLQADGELQANYSLRSMPLAFANLWLPVSIMGTIEGRGEVRRTAQGMWFGDASIRSPAGRISHSKPRATGAGEALLSYDELRIAASMSGTVAHASLSAYLDGAGALDGELTLAGVDRSSTTIDGRVSASIPSVASLAVFAPQLAKIHGHAEASTIISGTLLEPSITARLDARDLAASVPGLGLSLRNGRLHAAPGEAGGIQFSGAIESGLGQFDFEGHANRDGALDLRVRGERVLVADISGARVVVTPDLNFRHSAAGMVLSGAVHVPEASIDLQNLNVRERTSRRSRDVIVVDAPVTRDPAAALPLHADVTVTLGPDVDLAGFGLKARATGRLTVREVPGEPTVASGQLDVTGSFLAQDREMTLQRGRLLYAASPLDDPTLDVVATREVAEITVGLRVAGTAKVPEVSVFSEPPMGQADVLSYLLAGGPLDFIATRGDHKGDVMQEAARSLGKALGGVLAQNVGQRLGIEALEVRDEAMLGGSVLTIGQYLSPRLYLSYGVGLFEPGEIVTLRFRVQQGLVVQAQRGPEHSRVGLELRLER